MLHVLWLIPFLPLIGFVTLALGGGWMGRRALTLVGVAPTAAAAALAVGVGTSFIVSPPGGHSFSQVLWTWVKVGGFAPKIGLHLDPLSLVMVLVVTCVGFLILLYSTEFMREEEGYRRFFAYMNLFIASMLVLVLADDFLFLLVGWEGVGLSSYLLIGFWYREAANGAAARKAFIVTRIGDTALLVGLLLLFTRLGSLNIQDVMSLAQDHWAEGSGVVTAAALLILGGAIGKSAQLPLQTWLPDAMAGPTPVSALIHAATMVTAGVYLVARSHALFDLAPAAQTVVAVIGTVTLLYAGASALAQTDIKRVLAYSTISQIGYMFLALGVGAWSAAIFHFMVHAFFKALLFLSAGLVIKALGGEHDIRKMGGLRTELPVVFWTFLIGAASLAALPAVTAGFYSKDLIIDLSLTSAQGNAWLWVAALLGTILTSLYAFRLVFLVFFGPPGEAPVGRRFGKAALIPVIALAAAAIGGGWIELPRQWGDFSLFTDFMAPVLPPPTARAGGSSAGADSSVLVMEITVLAIYAAYVLFARPRGRARDRRRDWVSSLAARPALRRVSALALAGWGFDRFYAAAIVRPFLWLARKGRGDLIDGGFTALAWAIGWANRALSRTQSGRVRYYVAAASFGVVAFIAVGIFR